MNSKRSYLDSLNAGRQRRPHTTLEQLNRSLETLEQRLQRPREEPVDHARMGARGNPGPSYAGYDAEFRPAPRPRAPERRVGYEQPYQSIARDIERVRDQEEGAAAFGKIAGELKGLREELRHQMTSGIRREFETLRGDIEAASTLRGGRGKEELSAEFERLSGAIQSLADRSNDRSVNLLRQELEQVKGALDTLAREETVRSVDRRWDDFDRRFNDFEHRYSADVRDRASDPALAALASRLEQINDAVHNLPESLSLRSLEDKVRTLAGAVEHFAKQNNHGGPETFAAIEDRLDEISRAIVASTVAAQSPYFDPEPFERIEARISALARQIDEVAEERPEVLDRLNMLSQRVDQLAARSDIPEKAVERLGRQIAVIADKIDRAPAMPDANDIFSGIEQRFDVLSGMIERRQDDALDQGNLLLRELERRLDEVADKIDQRQTDAALDSHTIMSAIDARFSALAQRIETGRADQRPDPAIRGLEARLEDISERLDQSASQYAGMDPDLIRNLEAQVAGLSAHLSRPSAPLPDFDDIGPRLDEIEKSIASNRDTVLEAARHAAENAARSLAGSQVESAAVAGLAQDLKALESLTRRSDERNGKTFEAIHDTLLKIVNRLGSLETDVATPASEMAGRPAEPRKMALQNTPSIDPEPTLPFAGFPASDYAAATPAPRTSVERSPAQAAAAAAIAAVGADRPSANQDAATRSLLSGLTSAFRGKKQPTPAPDVQPKAKIVAEPPIAAAPAVNLDAPLDPRIANRPLEPGSGAPDLNAIMKRVRDERGQPAKAGPETAKSDFIAAARRAAQAAAAEAEVLKRGAVAGGPAKSLRLSDILKSRRKPILMAAAAIMLALAGLQLGKAFMSQQAEIASLDMMPAAAEPELDPATMGSTPPVMADATAAGGASLLSKAPADPVRLVGGGEQKMLQPATSLPDPLDRTASTPPDASATEVASAPAVTLEIKDPVPAAPVQAEQPAAAVAPLEAPANAGPPALREAADAGDPKALFVVATHFADSRGGKADMATAAAWYEKSAELGFAPAQYRIGNFYEKGIGVARDIAKAKTWYQMAANQGNASAMHNLAVLFAMGADGVTDNESAGRWFIKAAELGVKDSQFNLGILTAKGVGMPQNLEESYKWFALVAKTGDKDASAKRDEVANSLRPEQLERARATAELWKPKPLDAASNTVDIPDAWTDVPDKTAGIDMKKAVQNIQLILGKNGYDVGRPDGVMGARTKTAIASFQKDNGLPATGEVDQQLVQKLLARK